MIPTAFMAVSLLKNLFSLLYHSFGYGSSRAPQSWKELEIFLKYFIIKESDNGKTIDGKINFNIVSYEKKGYTFYRN